MSFLISIIIYKVYCYVNYSWPPSSEELILYKSYGIYAKEENKLALIYTVGFEIICCVFLYFLKVFSDMAIDSN